MPRTDNDSWDIATSVGATAVMVALARAAETESANPLIRDEYAEQLVSTPQLAEVRDRIASLWRRPDVADDDGFAMDFQQMIDYQAVRTHFFDEFFAKAAAAGISQHVILAAGLDSRAYRLDWPAGTVVYEIDMPAVLEYKAATLAQTRPRATRRGVAADLRHDWPATLRGAGFDADSPATWLAEGLLPFLPGQAQESLYSAIDSLSAPGSRVAVEVFAVSKDARAYVEERWRQVRVAREERGEDVVFDPFDLWYHQDDWPDCAAWFAKRGWATQSAQTRAEFERLGRPVRETDDEHRPFVNSFVTAERPAQPTG
ncbi:MAG TPA: class I SAM-dependent methyltransferase [Mycobacterium sp.]